MGIKGVHKVGKMKQKIRAKSYNNRFKRVKKKGRPWCTNRGKREQKQFTNSKGEKRGPKNSISTLLEKNSLSRYSKFQQKLFKAYYIGLIIFS